MARRTTPRHSARRKPASPGVMLRGRAAGFHHYDDEVSAPGGKPVLRRRVRRTETHALRREFGFYLGAQAIA